MSRKIKRNNYANAILDVSMGMDDRFAFIAGYTPGGFPYGTTWEELGIDPELPLTKKVRLYDENLVGVVNGLAQGKQLLGIDLPDDIVEIKDIDLPF